MKTIKYRIIVFFLLIFSCSIYAQYIGGDSDGSTSETVSTVTCSTPPSFYPYFGGNADGSTIDTFENTTCPFPNHFYAYFGGNADGEAVETVENTVCGFPPQFYTYFGGINDGSAVDTTPSICAVNPPVANFTASLTAICVGQMVTFTDASSNQPFIWNWTFAGGSPSSSTAQNPVVTYNTAGTYEVKLVATNYNGSGTEIKANYITVSSYPNITSTVPASRCDAGFVTLQATSNVGTINWYANATGGTILATGTSFTTPSLANTTTYYVETVNGTCSSARTAVVATVNATPAIISTTPAVRCGSGTVVLQAVANSGTVQWFANATGGTALHTGSNYTTPSLTATTSYFVQVTENTCVSPRVEVIATINSQPTITSTTPASRCDSGTVTLQAVANNGILNWFATPTGGTSLATGSSFTTPIIANTTTYYVEAVNGNCISSRLPISATITNVSAPTGNSTQTFCNGTTVSQLVANGTNIIWYDASSGGNILQGTSLLVSGTTYYATQNNGNCESSARLAVTANLVACLSVNETEYKEIKLYPIPVVDVLNISNSNLISNVSIFDMSGKIIYSSKFNDKNIKINMSAFPAAGYLVIVRVNEESKSFKILKK